MQAPDSAGRWDAVRPLFVGVLLLLGIVLVVVPAAFMASRVKHERALRAWEARIGTLEEVLARYPARPANATALDVERVAARLGIDVVPRGVDADSAGDTRVASDAAAPAPPAPTPSATRRSRPGPDEARRWRKTRPRLDRFLSKELARPRERIGPVPEPVSAFLARHEMDLDALRRRIATSELPEWERDVGQLYTAQIPNLLGQLDLHRLLLVDALVARTEGRNQVALADLETSWRLNAALRDSPILISTLVSMAVARMQAGVLRQLEGTPTVWLDRLHGDTFRESLLRSLELEGWMWLHLPEDRDGPRWQRSLRAVFLTPYLRYGLADASDRWRRRLARLSELDYVCDRNLAAAGASPSLNVPFWNVPGRTILPSLGETMWRLARLELDLELTRKILELRTLAERSGRWPAEPTTLTRSTACPDDRWIYEASPSGEAVIAFPREPGWPASAGTPLPTRFTLGALDSGGLSPVDRGAAS